MWAGCSDTLLTNRIEQSDGMSCLRLGYEKPVALSCLSSLILLLANANGSQTQCCQLPYKEAHMARN